jgi:hypothetical protein
LTSGTAGAGGFTDADVDVVEVLGTVDTSVALYFGALT